MLVFTVRIRIIYIILILIASGALISWGVQSLVKNSRAARDTRHALTAYQNTADSLAALRYQDSITLDLLLTENTRIGESIELIRQNHEAHRYRIASLHTDSILIYWEAMRARLDSLTGYPH